MNQDLDDREASDRESNDSDHDFRRSNSAANPLINFNDDNKQALDEEYKLRNNDDSEISNVIEKMNTD